MRRTLLVTAAVFVAICSAGVSRAEDPPFFLFDWGGEGVGGGQFNNPLGVAVDSQGHIYVADYANHRVQKFDSSGGFLLAWGTYGVGSGQFSYPQGIAIDGEDRVYVSEGGNHRIQKFDTNG